MHSLAVSHWRARNGDDELAMPRRPDHGPLDSKKGTASQSHSRPEDTLVAQVVFVSSISEMISIRAEDEISVPHAAPEELTETV